LMLVCARLRHASATGYSAKTYLNMKHLYKPEHDRAESSHTANA
jgi:hypothetical protein